MGTIINIKPPDILPDWKFMIIMIKMVDIDDKQWWWNKLFSFGNLFWWRKKKLKDWLISMCNLNWYFQLSFNPIYHQQFDWNSDCKTKLFTINWESKYYYSWKSKETQTTPLKIELSEFPSNLKEKKKI